MISRLGQTLGRLAANTNFSQQTKRSLYPHYLRYMAVYPPGHGPIPFVERVGIYIAFMVGILGPPSYIMYDVGHRRKR